MLQNVNKYPSRDEFESDDEGRSLREAVSDSEGLALTQQLPPYPDVNPAAANPWTGLKYYDTSLIQPELRKVFSQILREKGSGSAIYWFQEVEKFGRHLFSQKRVIIIAESAVYQSDPKTSCINRCVSIPDIEKVLHTDTAIGLKIPSQYDILFDAPKSAVAEMLKILIRVHAALCPDKVLEVKSMAGFATAELKASLQIQKPKRYQFQGVKIVKIPSRKQAALPPAARASARRSDTGDARGRSSSPGSAASPADAARRQKSWKTPDGSPLHHSQRQQLQQQQDHIRSLEEKIAGLQARAENASFGASPHRADDSDCSGGAEWQKKYQTVRNRERQLEGDVKRASDEAESSQRELASHRAEIDGLRKQLHAREMQAGALQKERDEARGLLQPSPPVGGGADGGVRGLLSLVDAARHVQANAAHLADENWRLTKEMAAIHKRLSAESRLKPPPQPRSNDAEDRAEVLAKQHQQLEQTVQSLQYALHRAGQANEEAKLKLFESKEKYAALTARHQETSAAHRGAAKKLERRAMRAELELENLKRRLRDQPPGPAAGEAADSGRDLPAACPHAHPQPTLDVGCRVTTVLHEYPVSGTVKYLGGTEFAKGTWVGLSLDEPCGKNSGMVGGKEYFKCTPLHGIFLREDAVAVEIPNCATCLLRQQRRETGRGAGKRHGRVSSVSPVRDAELAESNLAGESYLQVAVDLQEKLAVARRELDDEREKTRFLQASLQKNSAAAAPASLRWGSRSKHGEPPQLRSATANDPVPSGGPQFTRVPTAAWRSVSAVSFSQ
ncbi:hypothetical protein DIPPA_29557 [Diplonema papillatum]|nr:hypothetical protein DIPPA_29557 [Diplonema papillatum]